MKAYPYKTPEGHCSILEAVDMEDAKNWLSQTPGTVFCEAEVPAQDLLYPDDKQVIQYLNDNEVITA